MTKEEILKSLALDITQTYISVVDTVSSDMDNQEVWGTVQEIFTSLAQASQAIENLISALDK